MCSGVRGLGPLRAVRIDLTVRPGRWVDLDSLVEVVVAGLRDGGAVRPRLAGLDGLLATRREAAQEGVRITPLQLAALRRLDPPGTPAVVVDADVIPRPSDRDAKRLLRAAVAQQAGGVRLVGAVWAELTLGVPGSLLTPLESALDTLEPVLGRDPRGRPAQEFFPNDHRIAWLRLLRGPADHPLRLLLGPVVAERF